MQTKSPTKREERKLMQDLMREREKRNPQHHDPAWVHRFWRRVAS